MSEEKIGIGVLSWAHGHLGMYAQQIVGFPDARMVACWDDNQERGEGAARSFGMTWSPDMDDVLSNPDIQCVMIGCETNRHADLVEAAAAAGKSILLQKPLATSLADCDRIIAAVERSGVWFSVAYQMRCDPQNIHMKRLVEEGAIGRVGVVRRRHCIGVLFSQPFIEGPSKWHISREANRGMWADDASHPCDWLVWMFGKPRTVIAEIDNVLTSVAPDDTGFAVFRYPGGMMAEVHNASITWAGENTTEIYGDRGVIIQNHGDGPSCGLRAPGAIGVKLFQSDRSDLGWQDQGIPIPPGHGDRIAGVARPFIDALKAGTPMVSAREARLATEMVMASYESAETGRRVTLAP